LVRVVAPVMAQSQKVAVQWQQVQLVASIMAPRANTKD
jgi:hypothetical protein